MRKHWTTKLKEENLKLKQDIHTLVMLDNSDKPKDIFKVLGCRVNWQMRFKMEEQMWTGSYNSTKL